MYGTYSYLPSCSPDRLCVMLDGQVPTITVDNRKSRCSEPGAVIITEPPCSVFASSCLSSRAGGEDTEFSYVLSVLPVIRELFCLMCARLCLGRVFRFDLPAKETLKSFQGCLVGDFLTF